jgi:hypothetical protein
MLPKYSKDSYNFLLSFGTCSQIWLIPLVVSLIWQLVNRISLHYLFARCLSKVQNLFLQGANLIGPS